MGIFIYISDSRPFGYATTVIYLAFIVDIIYFLRKRPWCRSYMGYTSLTAASASMLYTIFGIVVIYAPQHLAPSFLIFFCLSDVCIFLPAVIGFQRMSQQRKSEVGQFLAYAGYAWSLAIAGAGAGATFTEFSDRSIFSNYAPTNSVEGSTLFITYLTYGFAILLIVYMCMTISWLKGFGRRTYITFVFCFVLQTLGYSVLAHMVLPDYLMQTLMLFFFAFPRIVCMCTAILHGHTWTLEYADDEDDDSLMDDDETK